MYDFLIERLMGLFWVMVQQFCFACLKYAHDNILGTVKTRKLLASHLIIFALLVVFCFEYEMGIKLFSKWLLIGRVDYYPWTVRITLCGAMIVFDSLLVLYFARIVRMYRRGLTAARTTWPADFAVIAFVALLCCGYLYVSITSATRLRFHMGQYIWIGRFFITISNFFYIGLEVGGAFLAWSFLRQLLLDKGGTPGDVR